MTITQDLSPFVVDIDETELADLSRRLRDTRWPEPLGDDGWGTGVPLSVLRSLVGTWVDDFDWRRVERRLRGFPQFTIRIDGQRIHFLHVRSSRPAAVPLLLCHGWPGSFLEFLDLIPLLTEPEDDAIAFDVVVPSVPGFAFSTPLADDAWTTDRIAGAFAEVMGRLGYDRYMVQGGDFGAGVAPAIGRADPDHCIAIHVNGSIGAPTGAPDATEQAASTELELDRYRRVGEFMQSEFGYIAIQSTRPQLIGVAMTDSPVGQLAWMLDKFRAWTFPFDAEPDGALGRETILSQVTLTWLTRSSGSSAYTVYAAEADAWGNTPSKPTQPVGAIMFAHDIGIRRLAERDFDIIRWTDLPDHGGHFAAMENPRELADDIRQLALAVRER